MNLEQVSHYIAHPQELGLNEAPALRELSEKHPYAAVFSLLYLTALANGKSVDLDAALQQHAYRLSDRTKLYHLVSAPLEESLMAEIEPASSLEGGLRRVTNEDIPDDAEELIEKDETVIDDSENQEEEIEDQNIEFSPEIEYSIENEEEFVLPLNPPPKGETEESFDTQEIEEEDVFSFITDAFTREQHFDLSETATHEEEVVPEHIPHEEIPEEVNVSVSEEELDEPETASSSSIEKKMVTENEESSPLPALQRGSEGEIPSSTRSFTSWLKSAESSSASESVPAEEKSVENPEKRSVDDIIDTFIREEPTITRRKTEFYSPSAKAKESLDEEAMPVSETLAKIYAAQGNYPKAIHVYHQLMLSFPEKKSLFAVQIEALKKKITT